MHPVLQTLLMSLPQDIGGACCCHCNINNEGKDSVHMYEQRRMQGGQKNGGYYVTASL